MDDPLDFDAQEQALLQQQARIKAMRTAAGVPVADPGTAPGWNSAVTGTHIGGQVLKTPMAALLSPIGNQIGADIGESRLNRATSELNTAKQADAERRVGALPAAPSVQDLQSLSANPLTRAVSAKAVEDRLVALPTRESAERVALAKAVRDAEEKAKDRANSLEAARIRAAGGGPKLTMIQDDHGNVTGGYDPKTNTTHALGTLPGGMGAIDTSLPPVKASDVAGAQVGNNGQPVVSQPVVGKKSAQVQKDEAALRTKVEEGNDVLGLIAQAKTALGNTSYGVRDSLKEGITGFMGQTPDAKVMNAQQLDTIAGNLASKYPRGPGSITDKERDLFVQYMGNVNNRLLSPETRMRNLDLVEKMIRDSVGNAQGAASGGTLRPPGNIPKIASDADFDALPPGARFIDPEGNPRTKPMGRR